MTAILGIALAVVMLVVVTWMLLIRALREKYAVLWIAIGIVILVLSVWPGLLAAVAGVVGIALPSNLLFVLSITLLLGVALHLSWELSRAEEEIRRVAEEVAILRGQQEAMEASLARDRDARSADEK
ncbi:DUF2304 domain-containing protein [Microbacterium paludicola]|uniref:DUF2304 domain-containing protein n=1 Tax=Microbacterium paludicola TaxID=300019 RepID=UPI000AD17C4C|nr:DUF2304 domain-containing protein [Microbacterium paludicola]